LTLNGQAFGQIAFAVGDVFHRPGHDVQRLDQDADEHAQQGDDDCHGNHRRDHRRGAEFAEHREGLVFVHRQTDVPVYRRQTFDLGEGDDAGFAIDLNFTEITADARGVLRISLFERLHDQGFVRVHEDLAVRADQEHITHAVEITGARVSVKVCRLRSPPTTPTLWPAFFAAVAIEMIN
jgi:hypothetical protein